MAEATHPSLLLYVAPHGRDTWSGVLAQPNAALTEGPFRTLHHARDVVRSVLTEDPIRSITVVLRGGDYYLDTPLVLDDRDGGHNGCEVVYCNYPNEQPVIYGGQLISNWQPHSNQIYTARVDSAFNTLYENGVRAVNARHPNSGYLRVVAANPDHPATRFHIEPDALPPMDQIGDLQVYVWPGGPDGEWNWFTNVIDVAAVDAQQGVVTLQRPARYALGAGSRFFFQRHRALLDAPGEFYLDQAASVLYYWPRRLPIEQQHIIAPRMTHVVACVGRSPDQPVRNIRWQGITFACSDTAARLGGPVEADDNVYPGEDGCVFVQNAENITFEQCHVQHTGMHGYVLNGHAQRITITDNEISDIGGTGVLLNSPWLAATSANRHNMIDNNHIFDCGRLIGHGAGIQLINSSHNRIIHNRIHHTSRYAISLNAPRTGNVIGKTLDGTVVTPANAKQFSHTRHNLVAFNDVSHANLDSQDTAPVQAFGSGPGNVIDHNYIHDSDCPFSMGSGIYLDDAADDFTVTNNLLCHLQHHGGGELVAVVVAKGQRNVIRNNIFANNNVADHGAVLLTHALGGEANHAIVFETNIVYRSGSRAYTCSNWQDDRFARVDHNLFDRANAPYTVVGVPAAATLHEWQTYHRYDQHTRIADPQFIDPASRDYRLQPDSPAHALGFVDLNMAEMGLRADFPFADPSDPIDRLFVVADATTTTLRLMVGDHAALRVVARTVRGFVADLSAATIRWRSAEPQIVAVDQIGTVTALAPGSTRIEVDVTMDQITTTGCIVVLVASDQRAHQTSPRKG